MENVDATPASTPPPTATTESEPEPTPEATPEPTPELTLAPAPEATLPPAMPELPWTELLGKPDTARMMEDIRHLCAAPRVYGSAEEKASAIWAAQRLQDLGYDTAVQSATDADVEYQPFEGESSITAEIYGSVDFDAGAVKGTNNGEVEGSVKYVMTAEDFDADMSGVICLIPPGVSDLSTLLHTAAQRGCKGVILNATDTTNPLDGPNFADGLVAVSVRTDDGIKLMTMLVQGNDVSARLRVTGSSWGFSTQNIVATRKAPTGDAADIIIISAHVDSMVGAPGATDNACGVAAVLECARLLRDFVGEVELRIILFGAEEGGALGAKAYVAMLSDAEKARIRGALNLDMFASKAAESVGFIGSAKSNDALRNAITQAAKVRELDALRPLSSSKKEVLTGDYQPFIDAKINSLMIAHKPVTGEYHMPEDTPDKIDEAKLALVCETAAAWAASQIHPVS